MLASSPLLPRDDGHNSTGKPFLNSAGIVFVVFICVYTVLILWGVVLLWIHRASTAVRIRGFFILLAAVLSIHVYLAAVFIVYPLNGWYKCGTEFWYMSIIFPLGVAIFQISNIRLLAYAKKQRELVDVQCWGEKKTHFELKSKSGFITWFKQADWVKQSYVYIGLALIVQLIITLILFLGSKRFSPNIGFFGDQVSASECRRGAEWIPSVVYQFTWTWIMGPWVLYKTRHIKDTHYWAMQTRLVILAGLPGTPMWLAFLYSDSAAVQAVGLWWPPAMWFAPGLIMMQVTSIGIPLYDTFHKRSGARPDSVASAYTDFTENSQASTVRTLASVDSRRSKELAGSFEAFEFQLRHNIEPLFVFAAFHDFTAENIQFLREVRDFRRKWRRLTASLPTAGMLICQEDQQRMYEDAARIFFELVCPKTSRCPINIDYKAINSLEALFKGLHYDPPREDTPERCRSSTDTCEHNKTSFSDAGGNLVAPWSSPTSTPRMTSPVRQPSQTSTATCSYDLADDLALLPVCSTSSVVKTTTISVEASEDISSRKPVPQATITLTGDSAGSSYGVVSVPYAFDVLTFDNAEASVKYLVYTNTWKSFVAGADVENLVSIHETTYGRTLVAHGIGAVELEEFGQEATEAGFHHGVLDLEQGPVAYEQANAMCKHCRIRDAQRAQMRRAVMGRAQRKI